MCDPSCSVVVQCLSKEGSASASRLSNLCPMSVRCRRWKEQHSCGSASSRGAPASRRSSCGRGSGATACSRRSAPPAATGSTRRTTSSGCDGCGSCSERGSRRPRRPGRPAPSRPSPAEVAPTAAAAAELRRALEQLDDAAAHAAFDRLLADYSTRAVLAGVVLPLLHELGAGWERGEISVAQEHFASNLLRGRLLGLARGWDRGSGRRAVLACPAGRAARSGARDLRALTPGARLADHVPGSRHPARHDRRDRGAARAGGARPRRHGSRRGWRAWQTPSAASATTARPSGSAARERGHSMVRSFSRDRRSRRRSRCPARARARAGRRRSRGGGSAARRRRRRAPPPAGGRRCSSTPSRACTRRSRARRSGRRGAAPAAPRARSGRRPTRSACPRS